MSKLFLLGAGASIDAEIPGSLEMSKKFIDFEFPDSAHPSEQKILKDALRFIAGGLCFQNAIRGDNPFAGVDIEEMFNAAKTLSDRRNTEAAAFVSAWHPALMNLEQPNPLSTEDRIHKVYSSIFGPFTTALNDVKDKDVELEDALRSNLWPNPRKSGSTMASYNFIRNFRGAVQHSAGLPIEGEIFSRLLDVMISMLPSHVWIDRTNPDTKARLQYLSPLVKYCGKSKYPIVTLNYDNSIELSCEIDGIEYDTGLKSWSSTGRFKFPVHCLPILKLHGSIDWMRRPSKPTRDHPIGDDKIVHKKIRSLGDFKFQPAVIFGERNKLTMDGPYISLLLEFQARLEKTTELIVVGYSFRDNHINLLIKQWLNEDSSRRIVIISPDFDLSKIPFVTRQNRSLLQSRIKVLNKRAKHGLKLICKTTKGR